MKKFSEYKESLGQNPNDDVIKYIIGLGSRLLLLSPEEVQAIKPKLNELKGILERLGV